MNTKSTLHRLSLKSSAGVAAFFTLSAVAFAAINGQPSESSSVSRAEAVSLVDLNLATPAGLSAARDRVKKTARRLCARVSDPLDLSRQTNYVECVNDAVDSAMLKIAESAPGLVAQSNSVQRNVR